LIRMAKEPHDGIIPVNNALVHKAAATIASAFMDDPSTHYALPNPARRANLHHIVAYYLRLDLLNGGSIYTVSPECEGVACWHPPGTKTSWLTKLRAGFLRLPLYGGMHYIRYSCQEDRFYEQLKLRHAPDKYVYLALLAVTPECQGLGHASKLIRHMLQYADSQNLPCYVETQNQKNVNMYSNYGFELKESTFYPPGSECEVYVMVRNRAA